MLAEDGECSQHVCHRMVFINVSASVVLQVCSSILSDQMIACHMTVSVCTHSCSLRVAVGCRQSASTYHGSDPDHTGAWFWLGPEMIHLMVLPNPDPMNGRPEVQYKYIPVPS